jgi:hypothetical protein
MTASLETSNLPPHLREIIRRILKLNYLPEEAPTPAQQSSGWCTLCPRTKTEKLGLGAPPAISLTVYNTTKRCAQITDFFKLYTYNFCCCVN